MKGKNIYIRKDGTRECKACSRVRFKKWHEAKKQANA